MDVSGMAYSDIHIYQQLQALIARHGPDAIISQQMIAEASTASFNTTRRALHRLMEAGLIEGEFQVGIGYKYRIKQSAPLRTG